MTSGLTICVVGGSNSVMNHGYIPPMVRQVENKTGRDVILKSVAIGGTFSHFGLWQVVTKKPHIGADVIIVEYVLNDGELAYGGTFRHWSKTYEGMIRKLRTEAPGAQIICPLLTSRHSAKLQGISPLVSAVFMINARYGVTTIDVNSEIISMAPGSFWVPEAEWYDDASHYSKPYQVMIADLVSQAIYEGKGREQRRNIPSISADHFANAKSAVMEGIFDSLMPASAKKVTFENSRVRETTTVLTPAKPASFNLLGEIVGVIIVSTRSDGVPSYHHGEAVAHAGLYRDAFSDPRFNFLMNLIVPDQYFKAQLGPTTVPTKIKLEVCSPAKFAALPPKSIITRNTAGLPKETANRSLAVADILYVGELSA